MTVLAVPAGTPLIVPDPVAASKLFCTDVMPVAETVIRMVLTVAGSDAATLFAVVFDVEDCSGQASATAIPPVSVAAVVVLIP
jgi:hypothetical protein